MYAGDHQYLRLDYWAGGHEYRFLYRDDQEQALLRVMNRWIDDPDNVFTDVDFHRIVLTMASESARSSSSGGTRT